MLLEEHKIYHELGPKDVRWADEEEKTACEVHIVRQTSATGEQINISVPLFAKDSREDVKSRLGMVYSILQDRMEEENKALIALEEKVKAKKEAEEAAKEEETLSLAADAT